MNSTESFHEGRRSAIADNDVSVRGWYLYRRIGHDERPMEFRQDGSIGVGAAGCERTWRISDADGEVVLTLAGTHGEICHLRRAERGTWRGRWERFERMPIELVPLEASPFQNIVGRRGRQRAHGFSFISYRQLESDVREFSRQLPLIKAVVGIPRCGVLPASMIALDRNVPLLPLEAICSGEPLDFRLRRRPYGIQHEGMILVVDDTIASGTRMANVKLHVRHDVKWAAIYAEPDGRKELDFFYREIMPQRQTYEWTVLHDDNTPFTVTDLDGVLCEDWHGAFEEGARAEQYSDFLRSARPLRIPSFPLMGIVTNRLEKHRGATEEWLARHGIKYGFLQMAAFGTAGERDAANRGAQEKAACYQRQPTARLFIESDPNQARVIHEITGRPVLCYSTMELAMSEMGESS